MSAASPQLSVVVPVYDGAATLASCLGSVQQAVAALPPQRRDSVEVVVCDNHSTDASAQIAGEARYACSSRVIRPPVHLANRTENWHHGLSAADGDWLVMLHADDALVEGALDAWLDAIASPLAADVGFVTARHRTFVDSLEALSAPHPRAFPAPALLSGRLLTRWVLPLICPFVPFVLVRRAAYEEVGGLDSRLELTQDWDLWIRLCRRYDVLYVPHVVGAWRRHATSPGYQRVNMTEHLARVEGMGVDRTLPLAVRWLARRSMHARVTKVLHTDDAAEAQRLRERAGTLVGRHGPGSERWLQASGGVVSATLYGLRVGGAVRAAMSSRRRPASAARA